MNAENPFEKRLERLPQRTIPTEWRQEILRVAREAAPRQPVAIHHDSLLSRLNSRFAELVWPNPKAWAGLAAVWVLVLGLNFAMREPARSGVVQQSERPSPQRRELLQQQERLLAELVGPNGTPERDIPKPPAPRSQGWRREDFVNT